MTMEGSPSLNGLKMTDIIRKKRECQPLTAREIEFFIDGAVNESITEAQIGAMLMAICLNDMTDEETAYLTDAMTRSGDKLTYPDAWRGTIVGKHSTGGVGDKVSLILVPALAACGLRVPKIAGRGLGHTGGTLDKLESIPGFRVTCTADEIPGYVDKAGCCIVAQTKRLVPADRVLYAIRDTTATVESLPLIAGSVMSKKGVESLDALVLEVTYGRAALLKTEPEARRLAKAMIQSSHTLGIQSTACLTTMDAPLGKTIGNALEVAETVSCLNGCGPEDVMDTVCVLGGYLLHHVGRASSDSDGAAIVRHTLTDGSARDRFAAMMEAQGVTADDASAIVQGGDAMWRVLPRAKNITDLYATETGFVVDIQAFTLADVLRRLGACREKPGDAINLAVGLEFLVQLGDPIQAGSVWIRVHHDAPLTEQITKDTQSALTVGASAPSSEQLKRITDVLF